MKVASVCTVDDCSVLMHAKSYCKKHYLRYYKYGNPLFCTNYNRGTGRSTHHQGYPLVYVDKEWVLEHRYIMEQHLRRKLKREEVIHHIDNDKTNNNLDNLLLCSQSEHVKLHKRDWHGRIVR